MTTQKFNNKDEFDHWYDGRVVDDPVVIEYGEQLDPPEEYPCIMAFNFEEHPFIDNDGEVEAFDKLWEDGYDTDEIVRLTYAYIYPSDFE